jgi:hypothetical protein
MEMSGQLHAPAALSPRKRPWYLLDWRLDGLQSLSERCGIKKNLFPLVFGSYELLI